MDTSIDTLNEWVIEWNLGRLMTDTLSVYNIFSVNGKQMKIK